MKVSIQDMAVRLLVLEDKMDFLLNTFSQPMQTGVVGLDGRPKVQMVPLIALYHAAKQAQLAAAVPKQPTPVEELIKEGSSTMASTIAPPDSVTPTPSLEL